MSSSQQAQLHLLCRGCEERFQKKGEDWVLANCWREDAVFPLRKMLATSTPLGTDGTDYLYSGTTVLGLDIDKLVYFGASVFWRAAVGTWRQSKKITFSINLGPYEHLLRHFLLGNAPFPDKMAMSVNLLTHDITGRNIGMPTGVRRAGYYWYLFHVPGIQFSLVVGSRIPELFYDLCIVHSQGHLISIFASEYTHTMDDLTNLWVKGGGLKRYLKK